MSVSASDSQTVERHAREDEGDKKREKERKERRNNGWTNIWAAVRRREYHVTRVVGDEMSHKGTIEIDRREIIEKYYIAIVERIEVVEFNFNFKIPISISKFLIY